MTRHLLSLILLTPAFGALAVALVPAARGAAIRAVASLFAVAGFLVSLPLWYRFDPISANWQFAERADWLPSIGASYAIGVDGFSALLILLTTLAGAVAMLASWVSDGKRAKPLAVCLLLLQAGLLGVFMSLDALLFFVCWEVAILMMGVLIACGGSGRRRHAARKFLVYGLVGSTATLAGILGVYFVCHSMTGAYTFDISRFQQLSMPLRAQKWIFAALFVGFAIQVPLFPLHAWLPDAQSEAPLAGSVVLAAVALRMGTYGFVRFSLPVLPDASRAFAPGLIWLALIGVVCGAIGALVQTDWRRFLAFFSVSSLALISVGVFALTPAALTGALAQQINQGLSVGALALLVGILSQREPTGEIAAYAGSARSMPRFATVLVILALAAVRGARLMFRGVVPVSRIWTAVAVTGVVVLGAGVMRLLRRTLFGRVAAPEAPRTRDWLWDLSPREMFLMAPMVALSVWIAAYPAPLLRRLDSTAARVMARLQPPPADKSCDTPPADAPTPATPTAPPTFVVFASCGDDEPKTATKKPGAR